MSDAKLCPYRPYHPNGRNQPPEFGPCIESRCRFWRDHGVVGCIEEEDVARSGMESLTPAERRVLALVGKGMTNQGIADQMFISPLTVRTHVKRIHDKLCVKGRSELAIWASREAAA